MYEKDEDEKRRKKNSDKMVAQSWTYTYKKMQCFFSVNS